MKQQTTAKAKGIDKPLAKYDTGNQANFERALKSWLKGQVRLHCPKYIMANK